ncbi:hypothetical protein L7F22_057852 [Adiantum nelumboides]|nr:hypothetical protein [Adiantum nelumboides]
MNLHLCLHLSFYAITLCILLPGSLQTEALGVNWGIQASHPLPPSIVVQLLKSNGISKVKLFDANSSVLNALVDSDIEVMVGIPNDLLSGLTNPSKAVSWVQDNIKPYMSSNSVNIK